MTVPPWWYVRAYPGPASALDPAVGTVLPWLRDRAEDCGARCWYFLRYWDTGGSHLRLRVQADPDQLDLLHARAAEIRPLLDAARRRATHSPEPRPLLPTPTLPIGGEPGLAFDLYSPELDKYGGPAAMPLAERVFAAGSDLVCRLGVSELDRGAARAALAVLLARGLVTAALPRRQHAAFWDRHRQWWSGHVGDARDDLPALGGALTDRLIGLPPVPAAAERAAVAHAVEAAELIRAAAAVGTRPVGHLTFHHLHMTMNRLGYTPAEEALLGAVARTADPAGGRAAGVASPTSPDGTPSPARFNSQVSSTRHLPA